MYKQDLLLINLQGLICCKTQSTNQTTNQLKLPRIGIVYLKPSHQITKGVNQGFPNSQIMFIIQD